MVTRMTKTTVEINDALLEEAKQLARADGTTLRAVLEAALRRELAERPRRTRFVLRDASSGHGGMSQEFVDGGWAAIRDAIYEGRGA